MLILSITRNQKSYTVPLEVDAFEFVTELGVLVYAPPISLSDDDKLICDLDSDEFGQRICDLRNHKKLNQADLAELANVTPQYLSMVENGKKKPKISTFCDILRALHTAVVKYAPSPESQTKELSANLLLKSNTSEELISNMNAEMDLLKSSVTILFESFKDGVKDVLFWALLEETLKSYNAYYNYIRDLSPNKKESNKEMIEVIVSKVERALKEISENYYKFHQP